MILAVQKETGVDEDEGEEGDGIIEPNVNGSAPDGFGQGAGGYGESGGYGGGPAGWAGGNGMSPLRR